MTFVDYDHDGDLDLFVTGKRSEQRWWFDRQRPLAQQRQQYIYQLDEGSRICGRWRDDQRRAVRHQQ